MRRVGGRGVGGCTEGQDGEGGEAGQKGGGVVKQATRFIQCLPSASAVT